MRSTIVRIGIWLAVMVFTRMGMNAFAEDGSYQVWVSNERSNDVTVIEGGTHKLVATISVGKRPRGIHVSPDGKRVYVATSGSPIAPPPLPGMKESAADDDGEKAGDRSADGIAVV